MADAFGRWLEQVLGDSGLVVYDCVGSRRQAAGGQRLRRASCRPPGETSRLAARAGADLDGARLPRAGRRRGRRAVALFHLDGRARVGRSGSEDGRLRRRRDEPVDAAALAREAAEQPARFSPNVLLRPIVQDTLFPTICYVAGPNELAYLGQLRGVYEHFGVPMPLMYPRASATLLDSAALRFLSKYGVPLEALQPQDEAALNELLQARSRRPSKRRSRRASQRHRRRDDARRSTACRRSIRRSRARRDRRSAGCSTTSQTLHGKMIQAAKRRDETLRRQYIAHARARVPRRPPAGARRSASSRS